MLGLGWILFDAISWVGFCWVVRIGHWLVPLEQILYHESYRGAPISCYPLDHPARAKEGKKITNSRKENKGKAASIVPVHTHDHKLSSTK